MILYLLKMPSPFGKRICTIVKCFPGVGNDFTPLQNAFPVWETVFHPCKMLSRLGKRFFTLVKCFPDLGNGFTSVLKAQIEEKWKQVNY